MHAEHLSTAYHNARERLLAERTPYGHWRGHLSSSALSTAVATFALSRLDPTAHAALVEHGSAWLAAHVNADGGWGDTTDSPSNLSTTLLAWCALTATGGAGAAGERARAGAAAWILARAGAVQGDRLSAAVLEHYGRDRTFSAPILAMCALAGRLGDRPEDWEVVPQLPFECALVPRAVMGWLQLSVVSYALPALIAVGLARHRSWPVSNRLAVAVRDAVTPAVLRRLERLQPGGGGFLEAAPLTGFVAMCLAAAGQGGHIVARRAAGFLAATVRTDGSWPIDTDLATWVTTLAVNALPPHEAVPGADGLTAWLLGQQFAGVHAYTGAAPGGWGWSDNSGSVPDGDDTAGALLALRRLAPGDPRCRAAALRGARWLCDLQNRDGGLPTFCRGWGRLPFDRSCPDITAHALRALDAWYDDADGPLRSRIDAAMARIVDYLSASQDEAGAWSPLWFGNQLAPGHANPVFGTAQVVTGLREITPGRLPELDVIEERGARWLLAAQNPDGGWGGAPGVASTIEETALAVRALAGLRGEWAGAVQRGANWLTERTALGREFSAAPIGLYFASLWYAEDLYPLVFTVGALGRVLAAGRNA